MSESTPHHGLTRRQVVRGIAAAAAAAAVVPIELSPPAFGAPSNSRSPRQTQTLAGYWAFSTNGTSFDFTVDVPNFLLPLT